MLNKILFVVSTCFLSISLAVGSPAGQWTTIDDKTKSARSVVKISERNGQISGTILKVYKQAGDTGICKKCPGNFKNKPIKGLTFMWGLKKTGDRTWSGGQILDPKSGKIYRAKATLSKDGKTLKVRGYVGISLLGRTQTWRRN